MKRVIAIILVLLLTGCGQLEELSATLEETSDAIIPFSETSSETEAITTQMSVETQSIEPIVIEITDIVIPSTEEQITPALLYYGNNNNSLADEINKNTMKEAKSGVVDIFEVDWAHADIRALIEKYNIPDKAYLGGQPINEAMKQQLLDNRNLGVAFDESNYCLFTENTDLRSFPTDLALTGDEESGFDKFQETVVYGCTAGVILHESMDGLWYFVQSENYAGWVAKEKVLIVSKEYAMAYTELDNFVIISSPNVNVNLDNGEILKLRFGQKIPVDNDGNLLFPCKESDVCLELSENSMKLYKESTNISKDDTYHIVTGKIPEEFYQENYLELNQQNLIYIMKRMLGADYCWGDKGINKYDCSSAVGAVYRCFGIILPRNTSAMKYTGGQLIDVSSLSSQEKGDFFKSLPTGTIVVMPGHACMIYNTGDGNMYFHCNTHTFDKEGNESVNLTTLISPFETYTSAGTLFSDEITYLIVGQGTVLCPTPDCCTQIEYVRGSSEGNAVGKES